MLACHAGGPGSIPGRCKSILRQDFFLRPKDAASPDWSHRKGYVCLMYNARGSSARLSVHVSVCLSSFAQEVSHRSQTVAKTSGATRPECHWGQLQRRLSRRGKFKRRLLGRSCAGVWIAIRGWSVREWETQADRWTHPHSPVYCCRFHNQPRGNVKSWYIELTIHRTLKQVNRRNKPGWCRSSQD